MTLKRINIELSAHCNYKCVSCPNTYMTRTKGHMEMDLVDAILEECENRIETIYFWNYGESLLHPKIDMILSNLKKYSFKKVLSSTGFLIDKVDDKKSFRYLDELIISINGLTSGTYDFHQKSGDRNRVFKNVYELNKNLSREKVITTFQFVVNKKNIDEVEKVVSIAKELLFKSVCIKTFNVMDNSEETFNKLVPGNSEYSRYENGFESNWDLKNITDPPCKEWFVVNWNGDVNPCCWDYEGSMILGNVKSEGVFGVYDSVAFRKHQQKIREKNFHDFCINCEVERTLLNKSI